MKTRFTIYCHTNRVNGRQYVGQTVDSVDARWKEHVYAARRNQGCPLFGRAIRKHGPESFDHEVLEVVATQAEADAAETRWIKLKRSRSPDGYNLALGGNGPGRHHEDSKRLIAEASRRMFREMTPEQRAARFASTIGRWTPERRARHVERLRTEKVRANIAAGQVAFWSRLTAEEKNARVRHQLAGVSPTQKSERVRKAWAGMSLEARAARVEKATASVSAEGLAARTEAVRAWQTAQAKLRTPEQRSEIVRKAWAARRAKYGQDGVKLKKTPEEYGEATRRGWANMTPEARAERGCKISEGRRLAKEARLAASRPSMLFNLLAPRAA